MIESPKQDIDSPNVNCSTFKMGDWICECGEHNFRNRISCKICYYNKPIVKLYAPLTTYYNRNVHDTSNVSRKSSICTTSVGHPNEPRVNIIYEDPRQDYSKLCLMCSIEDKIYIIDTCGHLCFCEYCVDTVDVCPLCRAPFNMWTDLLKLYK